MVKIKVMNKQENIRRVLKEETNLPHYIRRRIGDLEDLIYNHMATTYRPEKICRYRNGDEVLIHLTAGVIEDMYYAYFEEHISYATPEWEQVYKAMETYIKDKFGDKVKQFYHVHCGD